MWFTNDAFHLCGNACRKILRQAGIQWMENGGNAHRRPACWSVSLDPDSAYVDVAVHGDGLTSLQYREGAAG